MRLQISDSERLYQMLVSVHATRWHLLLLILQPNVIASYLKTPSSLQYGLQSLAQADGSAFAESVAACSPLTTPKL